MKRPLWNVLRPWQYLTIAALLILGCRGKDGNYFLPNPFGPPIQLTDITPPTIENLLPATDIVLSERFISADVFDGPGAGNEPITGLNATTLRASYGTLQLPFTRVGTSNTYNFDLSAIGEGRREINFEARDYAGNLRTRLSSLTTDWSGPTVTWNGAATGSGSQLSAPVNFTGTFGDANGISQAVYYIRQPVNGQCTASGPLFPTGSGPGTVSQNQFQLGAAGNYSIDLTLNGPVNNQRPAMISYCWTFHGEDAARGLNGLSRPNPTDRSWKFDFTWLAAPPSAGTISGRVTVNTTSPLPGITVTSGPVSTTTDANGNYTLNPVDPGTRTVALSGLPLDVQCSPSSKAVDVVTGQTATADFNCTRNDFTLSLAFSYVNVAPALRYSCVNITASPAVGAPPITGGTFSTIWTGPGVVGTTTRTATLPSSNQALDRQQISLSGTYGANVSVTANGVTKVGTGSVTVGDTQGSCVLGTQNKTAVVGPPTSDTHGHEPFIAQAGTRTVGVNFTQGTTVSISGLLANSNIVLSGTVSGNDLTLSGSGVINLAGGQTRNATVGFTGTISATAITGSMSVTIQGFPNPTRYPVTITF